MAELRDEMQLDVSQALTEIEKLEVRLDRLFRPREMPTLPVPRLPQQGTPSTPSPSRPEKRAEEAAIDRLANRLRVVQAELKRLGDDATPRQLEVLEARLARLTKQAELLAPGLDKSGRGAVRLAQVMNGLIGTSGDLNDAMSRMGGAGKAEQRTAALDRQVRDLGKTVASVRSLWQTQILTDEEAGRSAEKLRDRLLKLASAEDASADSVLAAARSAAQAQRVLDASNGEQTKGGFAYSASIGILDALSRMGGPAGATAGLIARLVGEGLISGLNQAKPRVGKGAQDIGEAVIDGLKTKLQIRSPSRLTTIFGINVAEGLALGMKSGAAQVAKAGFELGTAAQGGLAAGLQNIFGPKLNQVLGGASGAMGGAGAAAANGAAQLGKLALSAEQIVFVAGAATTAVIALGAGLAMTVRSGAALEEQLVNIKALTQPTAQELLQLKDAAMNLGTDLGVGPKEAASAILELNKAGLSAADAINGGLVGALNLAGAAGITANEGASLAVSAMTAFQKTSADLPRIADVYANFANKTTLGAQDLASALAAVGPVAYDAGLDLNDFAGYMATLAQGGFRNMSDAGTSLKTMLLSLQAPSDTARARLKQLEVSAYDATGKARPLADVLSDLRRATANLTEEAKKSALKDIFGSDAVRAGLILLRATPQAIEDNIKAMGLQGEAARVARERMESLAGQGKILKANWEQFTATIGLMLLPALTGLVKGVNGVLTGLNAMLNSGDKLKRYLQDLGIIVTGAGLAYAYLRREMIATAAVNFASNLPALMGAARLAVLGAATAIKTTYIPALVEAAKASAAFLAANPWLLVIAGVTAAAVAINNLYGDISNSYAQVDAANQSSFEATMKRVRALNAEGTELSRTKAKYLLALESLKTAEQGQLTGVTVFGERQYKVDPAEVQRAQALVKGLREEITRLNTEQGRRPAQSTRLKTLEELDPEQLKKQAEALKELRTQLSEKGFELKLRGMTELQQQLARLGNEFDALSIKVKTAFNFDLNNPKLLQALADIRQARTAQSDATIRAELDSQRKLRLDHERDVLSAENALNRDALERRRNELNAEISKTRTTYDEQIKTALSNAGAVGPGAARKELYAEAAALQAQQNREILALERQRDQELSRIAEERLSKVRAAQRATLDAQASAVASSIALLEQQRERELSLAGDVPSARLEIEQRYAAQLARLQTSQLATQASQQRSALLETYRQQMRDAQEAGAQRGALESSARQQYLLGLQTLERDQQTRAAQATLALEERVQRERLAIYQKGLDLRMSRLRDATAQEIQALERTLQAERARAAAAGNGGQVAAIDKAVGEIQSLKLDNVRAFREELSSSEKTAAELQKRLAEINQTPLGRARSAAAQPFNDIIKGVDAQLAQLRDKLRKTELSPELRDRYLRDEAELTRVRVDAAAQRAQAILTAEQRLAREQQDKAQENRLKLAKTRYDSSLNSADYRAALQQDQAYWQARLLLAKQKGSEEQQQLTEQRLADNAREQEALTQGDRQRRDAGLEADRKAAQSSLDLARTDQARATARARLIALERQGLDITEQELAALPRTLANEARRQELEDRRADRQRTLLTLLDEERKRTDELVDSELRLVGARDALAAATARSNAEVLAAKVDAARGAALDIADIDRKIAEREKRGLTDAQVNDLVTQRLQKQASLYEQQRAIRQTLTGFDQQGFDLAEARLRVEQAIGNTGTDSLRQHQQGLAATQRQLVQVERQLALAQTNLLTEQEVNDLRIKRLGLIEQEISQVQALNDARRQQAEQAAESLRPTLEAAIQNQRGEAEQQLQTLAEYVQTQQAALTRLRAQLEAEQLAGVDSFDTSREIAMREGLTADAQLKLNLARRAAAELNHALVQSEQDLAAQLRDGTEASRAAEQAQLALGRSAEALAAAQREYEAANRGENKERLKTATEALVKAITDERSAVKALSSEYDKQISSIDSVAAAKEKLASAIKPDPNERIDSNREIDRFFAIEQRREAAREAVQQALRTGDQRSIAEAVGTLADQEKRYREQQALLSKNGVRVSLSNTKTVSDLLDQLDQFTVQGDRDAALLQQRRTQLDQQQNLVETELRGWKEREQAEQGLLAERARIAEQELEAARTYVSSAAEMAQVVGALRAAVQAAGAYQVTPVPRRDPEARAAPTSSSSSPDSATQGVLADMTGWIQQLPAQFARVLDQVLLGRQQGPSNVNAAPPAPIPPHKSVTVTQNWNFYTTLDGQPIPTAQEFRRIAQQVVDENLGKAMREKDWSGPCP